MSIRNFLSSLPKVDQVLSHEILVSCAEKIPRVLIVRAVREHIDGLRKSVLAGHKLNQSDISLENVAKASLEKAQKLQAPSLQSVINATGVVVHTNLGRSILAKSAIERLVSLNKTYSNLEYDLKKGKRGSRYSHVENLLKELTGAESALVVNNNAAAVYLGLGSLAFGKEVILSRGQMVEIGGSFRIPDVMERSGAILRSVGATNKTHLHDYERAITTETALLLKVHTSNFAVVGFHKEVKLEELKTLGERYKIPVMEDLGSGSFIDFQTLGLAPEPTVMDSLKSGADLITFSGDKLLGGPQAGIILGRKDLIEKLRTNPVNRAFRIDKLTLAALEATLELYREPQKAVKLIPTLNMITLSLSELSGRAQRLVKRIKALKRKEIQVSTLKGASKVGGGALPLADPPTRLVEISVKGMSATKLEAYLRAFSTPIICRLEDGRLLMDMRTLQKNDAAIIAKALEAALREVTL